MNNFLGMAIKSISGFVALIVCLIIAYRIAEASGGFHIMLLGGLIAVVVIVFSRLKF